MHKQNKVKTELSKIKKENPFRVPDNYFDDFYARLHVSLETKEKILPKKENKIIRLLKPALGLAASFILIFMLVNWPIKTFLRDNAEGITVEISDIEYFSVIDKIDENTFYGLLEASDDTDDFSDNELINYISANVSEYEICLTTDY